MKVSLFLVNIAIVSAIGSLLFSVHCTSAHPGPVRREGSPPVASDSEDQYLTKLETSGSPRVVLEGDKLRKLPMTSTPANLFGFNADKDATYAMKGDTARIELVNRFIEDRKTRQASFCIETKVPTPFVASVYFYRNFTWKGKETYSTLFPMSMNVVTVDGKLFDTKKSPGFAFPVEEEKTHWGLNKLQFLFTKEFSSYDYGVKAICIKWPELPKNAPLSNGQMGRMEFIKSYIPQK
eukprot:Nk52_evm3s329 gene=Nk52_evmTU3s329